MADNTMKPSGSTGVSPPVSRSGRTERKGEERIEGTDVGMGDYGMTVFRLRKSLENVLFNPANKVTKAVQKAVLEKFGKVEDIARSMVERLSRAERRLHERDDLEKSLRRLTEAVSTSPVGGQMPTQRKFFVDIVKRPTRVVIVKPVWVPMLRG